MVEVVIPCTGDRSHLDDSARRQALGRFSVNCSKPAGLHDVLAEASANLKREARASGLTDDPFGRA